MCLECSPSQARHLNNNSCTCCAKLLPRNAFSDVMQKCRDYKKWKCDACLRPTCTSRGVQEPTPLNRSITTGTHICYRCAYPACANGCGTFRPDTAKRYRVDNMPRWMCADCKEYSNTRKQMHTQAERTDTPDKTSRSIILRTSCVASDTLPAKCYTPLGGSTSQKQKKLRRSLRH